MQCMNFVSGMPILFGFVMTTGGPQAAVSSWILVSTVSCFVALSLAEIAAALPITRGTYFWTLVLGGPEWGPFLSWMTAVGILSSTTQLPCGSAADNFGSGGTGLLGSWEYQVLNRVRRTSCYLLFRSGTPTRTRYTRDGSICC